MTHPLRLGIAGLGTVGMGVVKILHEKQALLEGRTGRSIEITAVTARTKDKDRGITLLGTFEHLPVLVVGPRQRCFPKTKSFRLLNSGTPPENVV